MRKTPSQKQYDKNITINEEEVVASKIGTHPDDMGEGISETKDGKKDIKMRQEVHNLWHQSPQEEAYHLKMIAKAGEISHALNTKDIDNSEGKNP